MTEQATIRGRDGLCVVGGLFGISSDARFTGLYRVHYFVCYRVSCIVRVTWIVHDHFYPGTFAGHRAHGLVENLVGHRGWQKYIFREPLLMCFISTYLVTSNHSACAEFEFYE
jgi:hypothetical protein